MRYNIITKLLNNQAEFWKVKTSLLSGGGYRKKRDLRAVSIKGEGFLKFYDSRERILKGRVLTQSDGKHKALRFWGTPEVLHLGTCP